MNQVLQDFIGKYKEKVDKEISEELDRRLAEVKEISPHLVPILEAMKELSVGGKRLRAMLVILGFELSGGRTPPLQGEDEIIKAGVVMELFHLGLLIHDDIMDRDSVRRGVKTIHARYNDLHLGEAVAICAGDYTFGWGMEIITSLKFSNSQIVSAMAVWAKYFYRVGYGQALDCMAIADEKTILQILELKSGEYSCVLPLLLGATLGGADAATLDKLQKYGMELGWVFQLRDDWLGEYGDPEKTGKPVGNDIREGKHTFAIMNGKEKTEEVINEHMSKARLLTSGFSDLSGDARKVARKVLEELVEWMGTREN